MSISQSLSKRDEIIQQTALYLVENGLKNSGIRALAKSAGISDRMLMYYFSTKEELIKASLQSLAQAMANTLETILPERQTSSETIYDVAVEAVRNESIASSLRLWFEIVGLAVRGIEPYHLIADDIMRDWENWITRRLAPEERHKAGELLARIEGALMLYLIRN